MYEIIPNTRFVEVALKGPPNHSDSDDPSCSEGWVVPDITYEPSDRPRVRLRRVPKRKRCFQLASKFTPKPVEWLWEGRIPAGALTSIDGDPGCNKSSLTIDLAARVSTGREMPDDSPGRHGKVLLLVGEDSVEHTVRPRLEAAGADLDRVGIVTEQVAIPNDLNKINDAIAALRPDLVVIDPLMAFLATNSNSDPAVRQAFTPLKAIAEGSGAAILLVRHLVKSRGRSALYRGGGSIGVIAAVRSALMVGRCPDDPDLRVVAHLKCNLGPTVESLLFEPVAASNGAVAIGWRGECDCTAEELCGPPPSGYGKRGEAMTFLQDLLKDGPVRQTEVEKRAAERQIAYRTLERAKEALSIVSVKVGGGSGSYSRWQLPATVSQGESEGD